MGVGLVIRLVAYFGTGYGEADALRPIIMVSDLAIGYVVFLLAKKAHENNPQAFTDLDAQANEENIAIPPPNQPKTARIFGTSQGSADDAGQEGPLGGADAGLCQKDRCLGSVLGGNGYKTEYSYWPLVIAALWVLNPAAFFVSSGWGFTEPIFVVLMLLLFVAIRPKLYSAVFVVILPAGFQLRHFFGDNAHSSFLSAFNFYAMTSRGAYGTAALGFMGISFTSWGTFFTIAIIIGVAVAVYLDFANGAKNYYLIIGAYFILLFLFATGMQHKALFPGLVFLLMHFIERRNARVLGLYLAFSLTLLLNVFQTMGLWRHMMGISGINVLLGIALMVFIYKGLMPKIDAGKEAAEQDRD